MTIPIDNIPAQEETVADRRLDILDDNPRSLDLVSALAAERPLAEAEKDRLGDLKKSQGSIFACDMLYSITHQHFPSGIAKNLWTEILQHKVGLSTALGRKVRIVVFALDYRSNIADSMLSATLVGEARIKKVVGLSLQDGLTDLLSRNICSYPLSRRTLRGTGMLSRFNFSFKYFLIDF